MGFKCGIVGLPNVGKSTLFNALTDANIAAANYPFCTIEPNVGVVTVIDSRLDVLANLVKPQQVMPTTMRFVDIAGLVAGASKGEGLGNQFLSHIREVQAIAHVVRCFDDDNIAHVSDAIDPLGDVETIELELALADCERLDKQREKLSKLVRTGDKDAQARSEILGRLQDLLNTQGHLHQASSEEQQVAGELGLLTAKPYFYVANVSENGFQDNPYLTHLQQRAQSRQVPVVVLCAALEAELAGFDDEEKMAFLADASIDEPILKQMVQVGYDLLGLQTFFTAGEKEVRAWTVKQGDNAQQAAGVIHTDFMRGFIRAEVIAYADYVKFQGEAGAKEAGVWRLEGKDYVVQDGDVIFFRVNT